MQVSSLRVFLTILTIYIAGQGKRREFLSKFRNENWSKKVSRLLFFLYYDSFVLKFLFIINTFFFQRNYLSSLFISIKHENLEISKYTSILILIDAKCGLIRLCSHHGGRELFVFGEKIQWKKITRCGKELCKWVEGSYWHLSYIVDVITWTDLRVWNTYYYDEKCFS